MLVSINFLLALFICNHLEDACIIFIPIAVTNIRLVIMSLAPDIAKSTYFNWFSIFYLLFFVVWLKIYLFLFLNLNVREYLHDFHERAQFWGRSSCHLIWFYCQTLTAIFQLHVYLHNIPYLIAAYHNVIFSRKYSDAPPPLYTSVPEVGEIIFPIAVPQNLITILGKPNCPFY